MRESRRRWTISSALSSGVQRCLLRGFMSSGISPRTCRTSLSRYFFSRSVSWCTDLKKAIGPTAISLRRDITGPPAPAYSRKRQAKSAGPCCERPPRPPCEERAAGETRRPMAPQRNGGRDGGAHQHGVRPHEARHLERAVRHGDGPLQPADCRADLVALRLAALDEQGLVPNDILAILHGVRSSGRRGLS